MIHKTSTHGVFVVIDTNGRPEAAVRTSMALEQASHLDSGDLREIGEMFEQVADRLEGHEPPEGGGS